MGSSGAVITYSGGSEGTVTGPVSSTDKAVPTFSGTDGQTLQNSSVIVNAGAVSGVTQLTVDNLRLDGNTLTSEDANGPVIVDPNGTGPLRLASGLLQLGGSTSSFPALKNESGDLHVKRADDSNFAPTAALFFAAVDGSAYRFKGDANVGLILAMAGQVLWSSSSTLGGVTTGDTGEKRDSAGVILDTNGSSGLGARLTGRVVEASTAVAAAPNQLSSTESRKLLHNTGATAANIHTLPPGAPIGYEQWFSCQDTDGITVNCQAGETVALGPSLSTTAGGSFASTVVDSVVGVLKITATKYIAISVVGTWTAA